MYLHSWVFLYFCFFFGRQMFFFHEQSGFIRNYRMGALFESNFIQQNIIFFKTDSLHYVLKINI